MVYSHSRVECFNNCPRQYKYRYIDELKTIPDDDPQNPLIIGTALHHGIETNVKDAIKEYLMSYPIVSTKHTYEEIKLRYWIPKVKKIINDFGDLTFEYEVNIEDFKGYIDLLVKQEDGTYEIYDFKYSNNIDHYLESPQLHLYKYYFEKQTGNRVSKLGFIFVPKVMIRQKKAETEYQFIKRLNETLKEKEIRIEYVEYSKEHVSKFKEDIKKIENAKSYEPNITRLCDFCQYKELCREGLDYMILPKNERTKHTLNDKKKIYLYGAPFSGKSYLANQFPDVLFLSTDGNYNYLPGGIPPHIDIKNEVVMNGRIKETTYAWEVFKEAISELEKKENDFKTLVLDLVDDVYEHCRVYMYNKLDIEHESDSGYGKGYDIINTEFLSTIHRFMSLNYNNIVITSHLTTSEDSPNRTKTKPVLKEKIANKLAGMVDLVAQVTVENGNYKLKFGQDETVFNGSRLTTDRREIENNYDNLMEVYKEAIEKQNESEKDIEQQPLSIDGVADAELTNKRRVRK